MTSLNTGSSPDFRPMSVAKMGFLVDRLNRDCAPLQFLRELTKNAIEGIERLPDQAGEIHWDVDWNRVDLIGDDSPQKLCIIDTGLGMTGPEMVEYINKLSSSIHEQSDTGNFGVGAKISAAPLNPEGLVYLSWRDGVGYMIHLYKDAVSGEYGLQRFPSGEFWLKIQDDLKPEPIKQHGTMVVLLGRSSQDATINAPPRTKMARKWILPYLNSRFLTCPESVKVKVREGWDLPRGDSHNFLRTATGQEPWLAQSSLSSGIVELPESRARVHWWILRDDVDLNSGHYTPGGHVAALFQNELYELVYGSAGYARLQAFGVVFGGERVVLYLEPTGSDADSLTANTARTQLLLSNEPLDWSLYAAEFRDRMPEELRDYQDSIGATNQTDHQRAIRERLKTISDLFKFGRYRPRPGGLHNANSSENTGGGASESDEKPKRDATSVPGNRSTRKGDIYALFAEESGDEADLINSPISPDAVWISIEEGTRSQGDLEDRAARYLPDQNKLLINGDFRAFVDMVERWEIKYENIPGSRATIVDVVHEWFEQQLIETIMSALALKSSGKWSMQELAELWSEVALTAAVLPRYHIDMSIKRILGQRLGRMKQAA